MIADATHPANRGRAFGFHRAMDTAGAFTGVLLSAGLLLWFGGLGNDAWSASSVSDLSRPLRFILLIAAAMSLASFALTLRLRDRPPAPPAPAANEEDRQPADLAPNGAAPTTRLPRVYWLTVLPMFVFALGNSSDTFLLLRASELGLSPFRVVLAYAVFNFAYAAASYPAGIFCDRYGRWRTIVIGWSIYTAVYIGFALSSGPGVWILMPLYGVFAALFDGVSKALITDVAPASRRGAAIGVFSMGSGFAMLCGSVIAGLLWEHVGHGAPFWAGAALAAAAAMLVPLLVRLADQRHTKPC